MRSLALVFFAAGFVAMALYGQSVLPPNPAPTCTLSEQEISSWFRSGTVTEDGFVDAANSVGFPQENDTCDFYKWSAQMFLWLTSPVQTDRYVFDARVFFDVSPADASGQRVFIPNTAPNRFTLRVRKPEEIGETGQAGGSDALISQQGSLVYYGIHVNDVYAYFLTGQKGGTIMATDFPTTQADLDAIEAFAGNNFADGAALAIEVKTSWVDASTVEASQYLTISAEVPRYTHTSSTTWIAAGSETLELALVGMHVVGSALGHPEMIWATFEHLSNTPSNDYYYQSSDGSMQLVKYDSGGNWLFMATGGSQTGANVARMAVDGSSGNLVAATDQTIGASNTYRVNPWGDAGGQASSAENNTEIISLNSDVVGLLADGDVRKNYIQSGSLWTQDGQIPPAGTQVGSLDLANSTMETYHQRLNCFVCHSASSEPGLGISHIYGALQPLP